MSKRLEPKDFHLVISSALNAAMYSATQFSLNSEARKNRGMFEKIWKANLLANIGWVALGSVACGLVAATLGGFLGGSSKGLIQMSLGLLGATNFWVLSITLSWRLKNADQIAMVVPTLELTPVWRAYCDAVIAIYRSPSVAPEQAGTLRTALNGLMEEGHKLESELESQGLLGQSSELIHIQEELRLLNVRITNAPDDVLRSTLAETRDLMTIRAARVGERIHSGSRSAAQIDLIHQTFLAFKDEISQSVQTPTPPEIGESELRTMLSRVQSQTEAVSKAVLEIKSLQD